ncbi:MAG: xanthine dehydrogenase, partial [Myxococcales bacterium]|nr:xanthine dehydrogenase [Myxococcales bacterium]
MTRWVGENVPRKEGPEKVSGSARYIDDLHVDGMWHGATVRSSAPRGTIREIRFADDIPWDEFVIVRAEDIPGPNYIALMHDDQPCLADGRVNHADEPVLLIAHPDRLLVKKARDAIEVVIDPEPAVLSIDEALAADPVIWGEANIIK